MLDVFETLKLWPFQTSKDFFAEGSTVKDSGAADKTSRQTLDVPLAREDKGFADDRICVRELVCSTKDVLF